MSIRPSDRPFGMGSPGRIGLPSGRPPQETHRHAVRRLVARRPPRPSRGRRAPRRAIASSSMTRPASGPRPRPTWRGPPHSPPTTRPPRRCAGSCGRRARRWARAPRASTSCTWPAPAARSPGSPCRRSTSAPPRSTWRATFYETAARADVGDRDLRARPLRADVHLAAADGLRDVAPRGRDRGGLVGPGVHPGRPLPVQREEVRRRPRVDDRGDPAGVPARDRRRLPEHRHRQLHAGRPVEARPRRAAARELRARGRAHGAHPGARDGRRHRERRRRDRRGRQGELDRRASCARTSTATRRSSAKRAPGATGLSQGVGPDRHQPRRRAAAGRRRGRGQARLQTSCASWARSPARTGWPARCSTAPRRCRTSCSTTSRRSRPRRSTSRPASRTPPTTTRRSRPRSRTRSTTGCATNAADERKDGQTEEQFLYTTRKKAIGPFKRQLWELPTKDEILASQAAKLSFLFTELRVNGTLELVQRYVQPVPVSRPIPESLRTAVAS